MPITRKTTRKITCKPPNKKCGGRCIPPTWDCRLKGEGDDNHQRAVGKGSDITSGLANIERGVKRASKGIVKLSPSEIEGGRRAVARGAAKLHPGDIQQKKDVQRRVNRFLGAVAAPVSLGVLGVLTHKGLKAVDQRSGGQLGYERLVGRRVEEATSRAVTSAMRNAPFGFGRTHRRREQRGEGAVESAIGATRRYNRLEDKLTNSNFLQKSYVEGQTNSIVEHIKNHQKPLEVVDGTKRSRIPYDKWESESLHRFYTTPRGHTATLNDGLTIGAEGSIFSEPAAQRFLARSYGIQRPSNELNEGQRRKAIRTGITEYYGEIHKKISTDMRQSRLNPESPDDVVKYLRNNRVRRNFTGIPEIDDEAERRLVDVVTNPKGHSRLVAREYHKTVTHFDDVYKNVAENVRTPPGPSRSARENSYFADGRVAQANYMARRIGKIDRNYGAGEAEVIRRAYYQKYVQGRKDGFQIELNKTQINTAAVDLARARGIAVPDTTSGRLGLLNAEFAGDNKGWGIRQIFATGTGRVGPNYSGGGGSGPTGRDGPWGTQLKSRSELLQSYLASGRYKSEQSAARAVDRYLKQRDARSRKDSAPKKGKPCGNSHIPKAHDCSKDRGGTAAKKSERKKVIKRAATVAAVAGGVTVAGLLARQGIRQLGDDPMFRDMAQAASVTAVDGLSNERVHQALDKLPKPLRGPAGDLVGRSKRVAANMIFSTSGDYEMVGVDKASNASVWKSKGGEQITMVSTVGRSVVMVAATERASFGKLKSMSGKKVPHYEIFFGVDLQNDSSSTKHSSRKEALQIVSKVKKMHEGMPKYTGDNALYTASAYDSDGKGDKRLRLYMAQGYRHIIRKGDKASDHTIGAAVVNGKFTKIPLNQIGAIRDIMSRSGPSYPSAVRRRNLTNPLWT